MTPFEDLLYLRLRLVRVAQEGCIAGSVSEGKDIWKSLEESMCRFPVFSPSHEGSRGAHLPSSGKNVIRVPNVYAKESHLRVRVFIGGWSQGHPPRPAHQYFRFPTGKQVFSTPGRENNLVSIGVLSEARFSNSSQASALQANLSKDDSLGTC